MPDTARRAIGLAVTFLIGIGCYYAFQDLVRPQFRGTQWQHVWLLAGVVLFVVVMWAAEKLGAVAARLTDRDS